MTEEFILHLAELMQFKTQKLEKGQAPKKFGDLPPSTQTGWIQRAKDVIDAIGKLDMIIAAPDQLQKDNFSERIQDVDLLEDAIHRFIDHLRDSRRSPKKAEQPLNLIHFPHRELAMWIREGK